MAQEAQEYETGLVLGKFYPLTKGHQYLIETAASQCRRLHVAVGSRAAESISPDIRARWISLLYPDAHVVVQPNTLPYFPGECASADEFYRIWAAALRDVCGGSAPDVLFTSEDYGEITAKYLGCRHIMVDRQRQQVPISGTAVRNDPFAQWEFMHPIVRSYFVKTICVFGPECTGKSTLCRQLARHFDTVWQPEWARDYLGERHCAYKDMEIIARGHFADHAKFKANANKILFMDTDAITTLVYSEHYFRRVPRSVLDLAEKTRELVQLHLFTEIDIPWEPDTSRDLGESWQRVMMRQKLLSELQRRGLPFMVISGSGDDRFNRAVNVVQQWISQEDT